MRAIPGSHKLGLLDHENVHDDPNLLNRRGERVRVDVDESQAVDIVLRPGEMSLHHTNIVHGSKPNGSDGPRIGFIVRFVTSRTTNRERPVVQARGHGDCSHLNSRRRRLMKISKQRLLRGAQSGGRSQGVVRRVENAIFLGRRACENGSQCSLKRYASLRRCRRAILFREAIALDLM